MKKWMLLLVSHLIALAIGFGAGIYALPILIAPPAPELAAVRQVAERAAYTGQFVRDLQDSDMLHWGEGKLFVDDATISLEGELAPGPDYRLYLSPTFVETEAEFLRLKEGMVQIGDVKTFKNFIVPVPSAVDVSAYTTVIVWCETFGQFITAAQYQEL